jgi:type IV pilus assembly protein PilP
VSALRFILLVALPLSLLQGCGGGEHEDVKQWMAESSRDLRGRVPPLPELKPFPIVSYTSTDKADPFGAGRLDPEKKGDGGGKKPDFERPREQLENFPLGSIAFIGLVSKKKAQTRHGLVQVEGVIYQVRKGNYIGQDFGRIVDITDSEIVFVETVQDPSGQSNDWIERQMTLQLQDGAQVKESK